MAGAAYQQERRFAWLRETEADGSEFDTRLFHDYSHVVGTAECIIASKLLSS